MLEKILEEIEKKFDRRIDTQLKIMAGLNDDVYRYGYGKSLEAYQQGKILVEDIIRNHMNDGWIPVDERLPDNTSSVLICGQSGWRDVGWWEQNHWWTGYSHADIKEDVVAWRPLPEPYRPEEGEGL